MKSQDVILALFALAQEARLAVFRLLVKRGPEGFTPGELADRLSIPAPTLSFHLKELAGAKLVMARREGRFLFYSADFERMQAVIAFLTDQCCVLSGGDNSAACPPGKQQRRIRRTAE